MNGYDIGALTAAGLTAATAAWTAWLSPWARKRRLAIQQQLEFHRDWNGWGERPGVKRQPGVMERLAIVESALQAPILNGRGERMIDTVERLDQRTEQTIERLSSVETAVDHLREHQQEMDQRLEDRFAEQIVTIGEALGPVD